MASQITHIVLADKLYKKYFSHFSQGDFYIGNTFPDIRKLADFDRAVSHLPTTSISEIQQETNAFTAGMKLHSYIDVIREKFVREAGLYDLFHIEHNPLTVAKLFEDQVLHAKLTWSTMIAFYDKLLPEELQYPVSREQVASWHQALQTYFREPQHYQTQLVYAKINDISEDWLATASPIITLLLQTKRALEITEALYDQLESLIKT